MTPTPRHSVSVAAVVVNDQGQALVIQRRDNAKWEPPGGVLELHESIEEGLVREVQEETGLVVESVHLTGVYKNMERGIVALVFRCRSRVGELQSTTEASRVQWVNREQIPQLMDEAYAVRVLDALDDGFPRIRSHDGVALRDSLRS
ncbi:MAG: NUDIX hydrolase [Chloroflexi bacterium]|nr:NUDIX hydrolase [Chloroflexota bacterium]